MAPATARAAHAPVACGTCAQVQLQLPVDALDALVIPTEAFNVAQVLNRPGF